MDEIITRWAADLSKYQKEFQSQAETVARWDRALVENSDKVKTLYSKTWQAEKDAAEVERQLTLMEENQAELDDYLNRYEKEIDNMMKNHGVGGRSDGLRGPDQERERTYKLAEKLQDRLNELNKDLTEMIDEINNTSQMLSKTGKPDDPVSLTIFYNRRGHHKSSIANNKQLTKVVRVLNSQLSQLQLIDSGAAQLQEKINKAQKESRGVGSNGWNGLGTDPSEDFYRSFRGGRSERFGGVS
jgi:nuclear pore complex protein Nup62